MDSNPEPAPEWMLPGFNPNTATVAELRSILLENNIPHSYTRKNHLVQLFETQVRPNAPALLRAHQTVKPSAVGIFDMRTGQFITQDNNNNQINQNNITSPAPKLQSSDRHSTSRPTPSRSTRTAPTRENSDRESTPQPKPKRSTRRTTQVQPPNNLTNDPPPTRQLGKRKASPQTALQEEIDQLESDHPINSSRSSLSPAPVKKRRPEPASTQVVPQPVVEDHPAISKKNITKPKHRRTTLHEAIESGQGKFSDFNPFQSGSEDDPSSGTHPPRSSKRQSMAPRPSMTPSRLPKSITTPNIFRPSSPIKPNPAAQHVPVSSPAHQTFLPKSVTTSNIHSLKTPARQSTRPSGPLQSLPSHRRLTLPHLQEDFDANHSFEFGTPEQIQQLLAPSEDQSAQDSIHHDQSDHTSPQYRHDSRPSADHGSVPSRRQSQLPPRTPHHAQAPTRSSSNLQFQTPLPRPAIQRIKLDEFVNTPAEKKLKINRTPKALQTKRAGLLFNPGQGISFLLKLGCLGFMVGIVNWYLRQAQSLGYCDTGMTSNAMTRDQRIDQFLALDEPVSEPDASSEMYPRTIRRTLVQVLEAASMIGLLPDCQPCPAHAICERGQIVGCEQDFVQTHSEWEKLVHGWIPLIKGPKCAPDTAKLVKIVQTAHRILQILRRQRGAVLCGMGLRASEEESGKALKPAVYGVQEPVLKEMVWALEAGTPGGPAASALEDEILDLAIQDLEHSGLVVRSAEDGWLATSSFGAAEMGLSCRLKLAVLKMLKKFKLILISLSVGLLGWAYLTIRIARSHEEKRKVRELVEVALNKLRDESWVHHTNPALAPDPPTLASAQLRDVILAHDHSPANRQKLWRKVEKIVEGNSNVRTKVSEIRGESIKVWEWIGSYKGRFLDHPTPLSAHANPSPPPPALPAS